MLRHAETQTEPPGRSQRIDQNAITLRITFYGVEQHRRRAAPLVDDVRDTADFQIPIGAFDCPDLAELLGLFEPASQAVWLFHDSSFKSSNRSTSSSGSNRWRPEAYTVFLNSLNGLNYLNSLNDYLFSRCASLNNRKSSTRDNGVSSFKARRSVSRLSPSRMPFSSISPSFENAGNMDL